MFNALYNINDNVFVGASRKTICVEITLLRLWSKPNNGCCVYIALFQEVVDLQVAQWRQKFGKIQGGKNMVALTGETSADLRLLESIITVLQLHHDHTIILLWHCDYNVTL